MKVSHRRALKIGPYVDELPEVFELLFAPFDGQSFSACERGFELGDYIGDVLNGRCGDLEFVVHVELF